jgi:hypothetical protein
VIYALLAVAVILGGLAGNGTAAFLCGKTAAQTNAMSEED